MIVKYILLLFIFFQLSLSQSFEFEKRIKLSLNADDFYIDDFENIFIINSNRNEIIKYNNDGKILRRAGGFGWQEGLFDKPTDILATPLEILITDYNNNRIQKFDKELNYLAKFETTNLDLMDVLMETPVSIDLSTLNDLYILDQRNKKIVKLNGFSSIENIFGGFTSGSIYFSNPTKLRISTNQRLYILDVNTIKIYDQFTNAIQEIKFDFKTIRDFDLSNDRIFIINDDNEIFVYDDAKLIKILNDYEFDETILKIQCRRNRLYLLTNNGVMIFKGK